MALTKRTGRRPISKALEDRPFAGRWSEEEAARLRQQIGMVIGPYKLDVDLSDPDSVRAALTKEYVEHLFSDEAIEKLCRDGQAGQLFRDRYPTWRYGIDQATYPCFLLPPTIEELEAIEDKVHLASIIRDLDIRGTTSRIRSLIRSTVEPEWSWLGESVQDHLEIGPEE